VGRSVRPRLLAVFLAVVSLLIGIEDAAARRDRDRNADHEARGPRITITAPVRNSFWRTEAATLALAGQANERVVRVTWRNDAGGHGEASGTANWAVAQLPLRVGLNRLVVTAYDRAGRRRSDTLVVLRSGPTVGQPSPEPEPQPPAGGQPAPVAQPPAAEPPAAEPPGASGASYYVAGAQANASDDNPGTEAAPWKTIAHAARVAQAGDTVYIKAGLYTGAVEVANSGEPGREIVFRAWPGDERRAILDGAGITIAGRSHVQVRGLRIQNAPGIGISVVGRDDWRQPPARFITVAGNHIRNTRSSAISVWGVRWGLEPGDYEGATDIVIEGNLIEKAVNGGWDECITVANGVLRAEVRGNELRDGGDPTNGGEGIDFKEGVKDSAIHHNTIHGLTRRAIYVDGGRQATALTANIRIYGNVVRDDPGDAIFVMSEGAGDVDGVYIYNNLVVGAARNGMGIYQHPNGVGIGAVNDVRFVNNTVLYGGRDGPGWGGIGIHMPAATDIVVRNNIVLHGNGFDIRASGPAQIDHNLCRDSVCESHGDPMFVNPTLDPATWDYRLKAGSAAIDWGSSVDAPANDMAGVARPQGAARDLGAYEYVP